MTTSSFGRRADTILRLYDRDAETLLVATDDFEGTEDYSSRIVWRAPYSGDYYVQAINRTGLIGCLTDYDLWLEQDVRLHVFLPLVLRNYSAPDETSQAPDYELSPPDEDGELSLADLDSVQPTVDDGEISPADLGNALLPTDLESEISPIGVITHTCPDLYGVDDTLEQAQTIGDGEVQVHSFDSDPAAYATDKDYVSFYLSTNRPITFTVPTVTNTLTTMELHDEEGKTQHTGDDQLVWTAPVRGYYYLSVSPKLFAYGCADVAGYELKAEMSPLTVIYLRLVLNSW